MQTTKTITKRIWGVLLALCMLTGLTPMAAFAAEDSGASTAESRDSGGEMSSAEKIDCVLAAAEALYGPEHWECRVAREHMELARRAAETAQQRKGG